MAYPVSGRREGFMPGSGPKGQAAAGDCQWLRLRAVLENKAGLLERQGSLVRKVVRGRPYWYLRYHEPGEDGRLVPRSVDGGSEGDLTARVREYLRRRRSFAAFRRDTFRMARLTRCFAGQAGRPTSPSRPPVIDPAAPPKPSGPCPS